MYDGIFDDVEHVKEVLASHGHNSVDETLVFELLEDLRVPEHVVKVLLGTRLKLNSNSSPVRQDPLTTEPRINDSLYLSDAAGDSNSSDDLEILEHNVAHGRRRCGVNSEPVDLTMDDTQSSPSHYSSSSRESNFQETEIRAKEEPLDDSARPLIDLDDSARPLIDLTAEAMEVNEGCGPADNLKAKTEEKGEEAEGTNSASESESEMGDYYRMREDSEESEAFGGSDGKVSPSVSPALGICQDFDNQGTGEAENLETGENRMEEMLEENNNDPNNNLEDIEVMEQNNAASTVTENLNIEKVTENLNIEKVTENLNIEKEPTEARSSSPKPGCSKDSYYADTDFCITDDSSAPSSENQKFIAGKRANVANIFEDDDFLVGNCVRLSDTKIGQDVFMIQKILPHFTKSKILSTIMEYQEAVNRVEITLWELLPDDKPAPVFHPKRKQAEDNCPAPVKKFLQDESSEKNNPEAPPRELPKIEEAATASKTGIIKPATLKILGTQKTILKPATFELPNSKPPATQTVPKIKPLDLLKPSRLEHLNAKIPNTVSHQQENVLKTYSESSDKAREAVASGVGETNAVAQKPKRISPVFRTELDNKPKNLTRPNVDYPAAFQKLLVPIEPAAGSRSQNSTAQVQVPQPIAVKQKVASAELNVQKTGAIPKKMDKAGEKTAKRPKEIRDTIISSTGSVGSRTVQRITNDVMNSITGTGSKGTMQKGGNDLVNKPESSNSKKPNFQLNEKLPLPDNAASIARMKDLKSRLKVALEKRDMVKVNVIVNKLAQAKENSSRSRNVVVENDLNCAQIAQKVGNMNLEKQILLGNKAAQNSLPQKADTRPPQRQTPLYPPPVHPQAPLLQQQLQTRPQLVQTQARLPHWEVQAHTQPVQPQAKLPQRYPDPQIQQRPPQLPQRYPDPQIQQRQPQLPPRHPDPQIQHRQPQRYPDPYVQQRQPQLQPPPRHPEPQIQHPQSQLPLQAPAEVRAEVAQVEPGRIEKQDVQPPKELFNPLINMFPDVDPNYIAELCISAKARNEGLESLVEVLLINGGIYPRVINPEPEPQEINPDVQYENLQGIFPDAHPEYLRGIAEKYYNDPEAMKNFVQAKLENPDYPTMAEHLKKIKITEQIKQYTVDFSPEQFLQIFPDPWAHFENPKRVYRYNVIAFEFLKCIFRSNKVATILRAYRSSKHPFHMSLAAKALEIIGPDMKSKRPDRQLPSEDIPLLQEYAFLKNKALIREYVSAQKKMERQEFKRLKENNALLECQCCYDGECMPSKCSTCSEGHVFCKSCIKTGSETKIGEGQTQFRCFVECKGEFTLPVLQKVLEPTMFSILLRKRQEEEVKAAGLEGLVSCPFCHFASIPPPEDKVFKCLNPECMKETCRLCKELNHVPLRCDEVDKGGEARHYLEEKMTEALVRKCYRCSRPFFKDEGCNKMTCPCGAMTCYICGEPVKDYRHFNGQGSDRTDLCPLWSDNQVLNAQTVRVVAEAAEKEILKKNPNLKIDAKALMPSVPQATTGPHQHIANAHVLPVQARRV